MNFLHRTISSGVAWRPRVSPFARPLQRKFLHHYRSAASTASARCIFSSQQPLLLVRSLSTRNSQMEDLTRRQRAKKIVENVENNPRLFSAKELKRRRWPVIIQEHARFPGDTGSPEVQVALLTERITYLTEHFKFHKKDKHSRRGLHHILNQRHKLLLYLRRKDKGRYEALLTKLNLKDRLEGKLF